jgi:hypothetical protein
MCLVGCRGKTTNLGPPDDVCRWIKRLLKETNVLSNFRKWE